jgi:hypothetical protein
MAGLQGLGIAVKQLERLVPMLGASSEAGQAVLKALNSLIKHVPAGSVTPAAEQNQIQQMAIKQQQNAAMQQQLKAQQAQGGQAQPGAAAA